MKKLCLFVLLFFFLFPTIVFSLSKEEMQQVSLKALTTFDIPEGYQGVQGLTITDQYIVASISKKDNSSVALFVFDLHTLKLEKEIENREYGHANDLTYDESRNEVLVINGKTIHVLDSKTFEEKETRALSTSSSAISKGIGNYIFLAGKTIHVMDDSLQKQSEFAVDTTLLTQGIDIYNDYVFLTCFESGVVGPYKPTYDGILEPGANVIYVYNISGVFQKAFYIPAGYGELESIDFYNGKYYLLFNSPDAKNGVLYTLNYDSVSVQDSVPMSLDEKSFPLSSFRATSYENGEVKNVASLQNQAYAYTYTFAEPGVYEYLIKQDPSNEYVQYDENPVILSYIVVYDYLDNALNVKKVNKTIHDFQNKILREKIKCEEKEVIY